MACQCIEEFNKGLKEMGAMVSTSLVISGIGTGRERESVRVKVSSMKLNSRDRRRAPVLIAQFCPFCGERYMPEVPVAAASDDAAEGGRT